jgi:hypothetical protein
MPGLNVWSCVQSLLAVTKRSNEELQELRELKDEAGRAATALDARVAALERKEEALARKELALDVAEAARSAELSTVKQSPRLRQWMLESVPPRVR